MQDYLSQFKLTKIKKKTEFFRVFKKAFKSLSKMTQYFYPLDMVPSIRLSECLGSTIDHFNEHFLSTQVLTAYLLVCSSSRRFFCLRQCWFWAKMTSKKFPQSCYRVNFWLTFSLWRSIPFICISCMTKQFFSNRDSQRDVEKIYERLISFLSDQSSPQKKVIEKTFFALLLNFPSYFKTLCFKLRF